jgi:hypothetical protein
VHRPGTLPAQSLVGYGIFVSVGRDRESDMHEHALSADVRLTDTADQARLRLHTGCGDRQEAQHNQQDTN